jgi:hypothetical protein
MLLHVSARQLNTWKLTDALMLLLSAWGGLWDFQYNIAIAIPWRGCRRVRCKRAVG